MALDKVLKIYDENGNSVDYDILASDVKFLPDGKDLPTKLTEMEDAIEDAAEGGGYTPPQGGIPKRDLTQSVQDSLELADSSLQPSDKTQLQNAINSLQSALDTLIGSNNVQGAIDTFNEVKAFLDGIDTDDPTLANQLLALNNAITALQTSLASKANSADVVPNSRTVNGKALSSNVTIGMSDIQGLETAIADAGEVKSVVINSDGANIVDEHDNNSVLLAPSARQMKLMYNNLMAMYNALANIAFTNGKPTLDWVGAKTKYTLAYGTLNGCTADVAAGQVNEGALRIKLTPTQASYAFTSVTVNGESVATTATGDADGSVYLDIIVNGNITVAATAISGRAVNFSGTGCSIGAAGVAIGHDLDTTITANEHFTLPASITVKIGNANVTHTYTRAQDNKTATLHIDAANITGDLTITCTAVEGAHAVLNLSNVGSGVTVNKANNAHIYAGDTITILPASGNKVTASATVGGNAVTLNGNAYGGYTYTIGSSDVSSGGTTIAITATASSLQTFSIDLSGVTSDVGVTWNTPSAAVSTILEGSPFSVTLAKVSGTGVLQISTSTMGSETLTPNNGVIETAHVTGDITISASVAAAPMKVHSYDVSDVTTIHDDTLDTDVHYIPDTVGNFNLYSTDDTGMTTQASYGGGKYPSGYYANGIFDDSKNNGKSYRYGYGERVLDVEQGSSFTLVWKGAKQYGTNINNYDTQQIKMLFYDRITTVTYSSGYNRESIGQFQLQLSCSNNANSNTNGKMKPHITYSRGGEQKSLFSGGDSDVGVPKTFPTGVTSYDVVVAFDSSAGKTKAWVITHDTNNGDSVAYSGEVETNTIFMPCVAIKSIAVDGLDIYNYAMTQDDVEGLISNNE